VAGRERDGSYPHYNEAVMASRLLSALPLLLLAAPALADHGGPLASAPMSPITVALLAGGLAFVTVLLLVVIVRLLARPARRPE
jgi:hypothetical protein